MKPVSNTPIELSVIVPLYNEEENVRPMFEAILEAVRPLEREVEIVFVDDGSRDATFATAETLPRRDGKIRLRLVRFRKNYGQTAAMAAGIEVARGRVLITMDGDLQNDPRDIPLFLDKIDEGYDLVVGWRFNRKDHWSRVLPSKVANWLIGKATGVPIKDNGCSLKAYRASLIKAIPLYSEMHRFIPAMSSLAAARTAEIKVRHHARRFGSSKYGFSRIYKVFLDLLSISTILAFHRRPGAVLGTIGFGAGLLSLLILLTAIVSATGEAGFNGIVLSGLAVLFGSLSIFMIFLSLLNQLIYSTMSKRLDPFRQLAARPIEQDRAESPT